MQRSEARTIGATPSFPRQIAADTFWFSTCNETRTANAVLHIHNSCYLLIGSSASVLIDTALPHGWSDLRGHLKALLEGRPLDYVFPTHPELPHMGNTGPLLETFPKARLIGDLRNYHLFYPDMTSRFLPMQAGESLDLGGRRLSLVPAIIHDLPNTLWGYDADAGILFVSDGYPFTHDHREGECAMLSDELVEPPEPADTAVVLGGALGWTRHVDAELTIGNLDEFLCEHPARIIAPAHGGVIVDPRSVTEVFKSGLRRIRNPQRV